MSIKINKKKVFIYLENKSTVNKFIYNPIYKTLPMQFFNLLVYNTDSSFVSCNFPHYSSQSLKLLISKNKIKPSGIIKLRLKKTDSYQIFLDSTKSYFIKVFYNKPLFLVTDSINDINIIQELKSTNSIIVNYFELTEILKDLYKKDLIIETKRGLIKK